MKKSLLALAALGAFAGVAHAQSSVTLYGLIDEGFNFTNNVGGNKLYSLSSGVMQGSRWGLRGTEDLGGGLKALFVLENGFDVNTGKFGQSGLEFGRSAYVGLSSNQFGTVTLGRQYDSVVDFVAPLADTAGNQFGGNIGAHPADLDNLNNTFRINNSVKYTSVNYYGLTFGGLYSLGGQAGAFNRNSAFSIGAAYANGPMNFAAAYMHVSDPFNSVYSNGVTPGAAIVSPVISGYASAHSLQIIGAGGNYKFGPATAGVVWTNIKFKNLGVDAGNAGATANLIGTATFNSVEANFKYQLTPAMLVEVAYDYTQGSPINNQSRAKYHQGDVTADYALSKRTDVYLEGVYQHASGVDSTNKTAVADINSFSPSSNNHQLVARVGIRHKF
jgi:predicted porin